MQPEDKPPFNAPGDRFQAAFNLHQRGDLAEAEKLYALVLQENPQHFDALHLRALIACQDKRFGESEALFLRAIKINPDFAPIHHHYGVMLKRLGRLEDALQSLDKAIAIEPDHHEAHFECADLLSELCLYDQAVARYDRAILANPEFANAYLNRGVALKELNRFEEAYASYQAAISLKPDFVEAFSNCGIVAREMDRLEESLTWFDKAISINRCFAPAWLNRGMVLHHLNRFEEAVASYDEAIKINKNYVQAYINRGNALVELSRFEEAIAAFSHAASLDPQASHLFHSMGHLLLLLGRFREGFEFYEWRKNQTYGIGLRPFMKPLWLGEESLQGKRIVVYDDQGIGDAIHFCRYVKLLEAMGAHVIFAVRDRLLHLMKSLSEHITLCAFKDIPPDFDFHCPLMSLPHALKTALHSIPAEEAYLRVDDEQFRKWSRIIGEEGLRIGVCWQGSTGKFGAGRSFALSHFGALSEIPGVRLISLHKGEGESQLLDLPEGMVVETLGEDFDSGPDAFIDTAAVMKCCHLVITSDTSITHLAGALGVKTWLALKHVPEWRWMLHRSDSPWYPTLRLFRQSRREDWAGVFAQIKQALVEEIASGRIHSHATSAIAR